MGYGCKHYRRRCQIRAPCCNEIYSCRHCHNEEVSLLKNICDRHELNRFDVKQVVCSVCDTEQPVQQVCTNCGVKMGEYFCEICKFFEDDVILAKPICDCDLCQFIVTHQSYNIHTHSSALCNNTHCRFDCCRLKKGSFTAMIVGFVELVVAKIIFTARSVIRVLCSDAFAGSCYATSLRDNHSCIENSMRHHCPICYEYLFDSMNETTVMKCGHTMHCECYNEMIKRAQYCCPICSMTVIDMSKVWKRIDEEIEATVMPDDYDNKKVWILFNDCNDTTEVYFHIIGHKCSHCKSYNTRTIAPPVLPQ